MTEEHTSPSSLDGIEPPTEKDSTPVAAAAVQSVSGIQKKSVRLLIFFFLVLAAVYILPALYFLTVFPRPDGSLSELKSLATLVYAVGGIVWLLLGAVAFLRIVSLKDKPRLRFFAMLRLGAYLLPLLFFSFLTPLLINVPARLSLEVSDPATQADLVAPVPVTFGMPIAEKLFSSQGLTPLKYEWDFNGDAKVDQETFDAQAIYTFQQAGVYTVACRVTMKDGSTKTLSLRLVIPRASFGLIPETPLVSEPVTFSLKNLFPKGDNVPQVSKAQWDFDADGSVDLETDSLTASTTYHTLGSVSVSVLVLLNNQTQTTLQRTFDVVSSPKQPFPITVDTEPATLLGPPPFGVLFTVKTSTPIAGASWDFGNKKTAEGLRVAQVFPDVGTFTVTLTARSESGALAKLTKVVRITNPLSIPDISFQGTSVKGFEVQGQVPLEVDITPVTSLPLISFSWDAPDAPESFPGDKTFRAVYRDVGSYYADLIGVDANQNVYRKRIKIAALPAESFVNFTMDPDTPTAPALVTFDGSDTFVPDGEITGFEWDFGDGATGGSKFSGARMDHLFNKPGTYVITLKVRTTAGAEYSSKKTLVVRSPPIDACFLPSRRSGKAPLGVRFETSCATGNFTSWLWDFGDNSQSDQQDPTHVFMNSGEYKVTLTATTNDGLQSVKSTTISVTE